VRDSAARVLVRTAHEHQAGRATNRLPGDAAALDLVAAASSVARSRESARARERRESREREQSKRILSMSNLECSTMRPHSRSPSSSCKRGRLDRRPFAGLLALLRAEDELAALVHPADDRLVRLVVAPALLDAESLGVEGDGALHA
jgi:hypothetical protein